MFFFLLVAALLNAHFQIVARLVRDDDPLTSLLFTATAGAVVTSLIVPWFWSWPTAFDWLLLIGSGLAGAIGHLCLIRAPFSYSSLVWATLFGFVIWGDWPNLWTWLGAALIIGSGLYIFHRERRHLSVAVEA